MEFECLKYDHFIFWVSEILKGVVFIVNQGLVCCFSNRGEKVSMGHFKEIETGFINIYFRI